MVFSWHFSPNRSAQDCCLQKNISGPPVEASPCGSGGILKDTGGFFFLCVGKGAFRLYEISHSCCKTASGQMSFWPSAHFIQAVTAVLFRITGDLWGERRRAAGVQTDGPSSSLAAVAVQTIPRPSANHLASKDVRRGLGYPFRFTAVLSVRFDGEFLCSAAFWGGP